MLIYSYSVIFTRKTTPIATVLGLLAVFTLLICMEFKEYVEVLLTDTVTMDNDRLDTSKKSH